MIKLCTTFFSFSQHPSLLVSFSFLLSPPFLYYANYKVVVTSTFQLKGLCVFLNACSHSSNFMYPFGVDSKP